MVFRKIFDRKLEVGEILFLCEGPLNIHERPFQIVTTIKGKGHLLMAFVTERDEEMTMRPQVEQDLDQMVQRILNLFKFKNFTIKWTPVLNKDWLSQKPSLSLSSCRRTQVLSRKEQGEAIDSKTIELYFMERIGKTSRLNIIVQFTSLQK